MTRLCFPMNLSVGVWVNHMYHVKSRSVKSTIVRIDNWKKMCWFFFNTLSQIKMWYFDITMFCLITYLITEISWEIFNKWLQNYVYAKIHLSGYIFEMVQRQFRRFRVWKKTVKEWSRTLGSIPKCHTFAVFFKVNVF